jgi:predicted transcriptional regulator
LGRAPKIYEKEKRPFKSDRELIYNYQNAQTIEEWQASAYELWDKYIRVVSIGKRELIDICKRNNLKMQDVIEDYESLFWEKFINQLYGVRLHDVTHIPNFSIYIRVIGYLRAMNRDQIKAYIKWKKATEPIIDPWEKVDDSGVSNIDRQMFISSPNTVNEQYQSDINKKIFWESIEELKSLLSPEQKLLLNLKIKKKKNYEIQLALNCKQDKIVEHLSQIKFKFGKIVESTAEKNGIKNFSYSDLTLNLQ